MAFARSLGWQSASLASVFAEDATHSQAVMMSGGRLSTLRGMEPGAKRRRFATPSHIDTISACNVLIQLKKCNHPDAHWESPEQLPSVQQLLKQGRPDASRSALDSSLHGPAQSASSSFVPHTGALQPMHATVELVHSQASLHQTNQVEWHVPSQPSVVKASQVHIQFGASDPLYLALCSSPSTPSTSPSTPSSHLAQADQPTRKASAARVVIKKVAATRSALWESVGAVQVAGGGKKGGGGEGGGTVASSNASVEDASAYNKYCHFCQHVKVKSASSMIACENRGCNRRFCQHCLSTHVADPVYTPPTPHTTQPSLCSSPLAPPRAASFLHPSLRALIPISEKSYSK